MLTKPKIVLMDEPFNGIDLDGVEDMISLIKKMNKELQTAFIISSHQLVELEKFCNRFIVINEHKISSDKYITENINAVIAIKLSNINHLQMLKDNFVFIKSLNDIHYFEIEKGLENVILDYMRDKNLITFITTLKIVLKMKLCVFLREVFDEQVC